MDGLEAGIWPVELEYRQRGRTITGSFPYNSRATLSDRGSVRKETFRSQAFSYAVDDPAREINLLGGHSFGQPVASKHAGSLKLSDTPAALEFRATLPPERDQPSWIVDLVKSIRAGLIRGISPGFRVPPSDVVPDAERLIPEVGNPGVMIREIAQAVLFELSLVTRPAYPATNVDLRAASAAVETPTPPDLSRFYRWL